MNIDSTLEFEKRRNIPVRYNRDLMAVTLRAMKRIQEIKAKRERVFYKKRYFLSPFPIEANWFRIASSAKSREQETLNIVGRNINLVSAPSVRESVMETIQQRTQEDREMELA